MSKLRVLDLFSGIGGFSLGLERTGGFETVGFCENNSCRQKVLAKHWPGVPIHDDVTTFEPIGPVDVVTAGFPCQDLSLAGVGAGLTGDRSGLFWHVIRTVRLVGRPIVLLENVAELLGRGMGEVLGALASIGHDSEWDCIQAADVGLPHRRNRVFIASNPHGLRELQPRWRFGNQWGWAVHGVQETLRSLPLSTRSGSDDGLSARVDGLGNAIVPRIAQRFGYSILDAKVAA